MSRRFGLMVLLALLVMAASARDLRARLIIVEINYHPPGSSGDDEPLEFVEVYNDEPLPFDVSEYRIDGGIGFAFPPGTVIMARSVVVVARDPDALAAAAGIERPLGPFTGRLGNDGDELRLIDTGQSTVGRVDYNDRGRWPAAPDGGGPTLVLRDPLADTRESESWGWSPVPGGTPGEVSFEVVSSDAVINEVYRERDAGEGWIELFNAGSTALDLSAWQIVGDIAGQEVFAISGGTSIDAGARVVFSEAELGFPLDAVDQPLFFAAGDGTVRDAVRLGELVDDTSDGRFPDGAARWYRLTTPTRAAANELASPPPIVISEIHFHPKSEDEAEEFLELTNTGNEVIDLSGFELTAGVDYAFPDGTTLAPGAYLVVARDPPSVESRYDISGVHGPYAGVLANAGEMIRLRDRLGNPVDEVRYHDEGTWPRWADGDGPSIELTDLRQDNSVGRAWSESEHVADWGDYEYTATQGSGDSELHLFMITAGEVLVDDIEIVREGDTQNHIPDGDFDGADPLRFWIREGTHIDSALAEGDGVDGTNALRIVASGRGDSRINRIERQTSPSLTNGSRYTVRFKARWVRGSNLLMTRSWNHGLARVTELDVPRLGGTPGRASPGALADSGPLISDIDQHPVLPSESDPVTLSCRVTDPDGVENVTLYSRQDGADAFTATPMSPVAGSQRYVVTLSDIGARRRVIEFYFEAEDSGGRSRTEPPNAPGDRSTYIYQYDDGASAGEVPVYRIAMRARDRQELLARSELSNHLLPASFLVDSRRIFHGVRMRYRGSPYLRDPDITGVRKGLRVRLNDEEALIRSVRITMDEQAVDPTAQVDRFVRHLCQKSGGIPYGERHHIKAVLAGAALTNTYEHVLHIDQRYLERSFGESASSGDLYKIDAHYEINDQGEFQFPTFTSWKHTADEERLRFVYKKRSNEGRDDFSGLMELLELMDTSRTPNDEFDARIGEVIDVDAWIRLIAIYRAVEDWDAIGGWTGKNVFLYRPPGQVWKLIPWDHDVAMGNAALQGDQNARAYLYTPYYPEIRRLLQRPAFDRKFNAELLRLMEEEYNPTVANPIFDATYNVLRANSGALNPTRVKSFLVARRTHILGQIDDPPVFAVTTNDGAPFSTEETAVELEGTAPYRIATILTDAGDVDVEWSTRSTWRGIFALSPGTNNLELLGFDARGELVATTGIEITSDRGEPHFVRGDANFDAQVDLSDAVKTLLYLFQGGDISCHDAADADDSGILNLTDPIYLLDYLFRAQSPPPPPFEEAGADPTADELDCASA